MKLARTLLIAGIVVGVANFVAFCISASLLGGDAISGKVDAGRFFVASHGKFTEVSECQFEYSRWHSRSVWVTHPLAMLCALGLYGLRSHEKSKRVPHIA